MKNSEIKNLVSTTAEAIKTLKFQLGMYKNSIICNNYVVCVGAYTVDTKWNEDLNAKAMDLSLKLLPSLWSMDGVNEIKSKNPFTNADGSKAQITFMGKEDYYNQQIERRENVISSLNGFLAKN